MIKQRRFRRDGDKSNLLRWKATPVWLQPRRENHSNSDSRQTDYRTQCQGRRSKGGLLISFVIFGAVCLRCVGWYSPGPLLIILSNFNSNEKIFQSTQQLRKSLPREKHSRVTPWDDSAKPPVPIDLFQSDDEVILRRHHCISRIRERQISLLGPLMERSSSSIKQTILLVDPAYHENVGDHMITLGEQELLRRLGWAVELDVYRQQQQNLFKVENKTTPVASSAIASNTSVYQECQYLQAGDYVPQCENFFRDSTTDKTGKKDLAQRKLAIWHGGGNWGDLWPQIQTLRIGQSFRALLAHDFSVVVGMPQSLFYRHRESEAFDSRLLKRELRVGSVILQKKSGDIEINENIQDFSSSVVLSWREHESYQKAQKLYPYVTNLLVPDIAFQLGPYNQKHENSNPASQNEQVDFLFLLRNDHESTLLPGHLFNDEEDNDDEDIESATGSPEKQRQLNANEYLQNVVVSAMQGESSNKSYSYRIVDWPDRMRLFPSNNQFFSTESIQLLQVGQVVICDRLHTAVLAYLSGISFVYLDQLTGKITKCLKVAFDSWKGCRAAVDDANSTIESFKYARASNLTEAIAFGARMLRPFP